MNAALLIVAVVQRFEFQSNANFSATRLNIKYQIVHKYVLYFLYIQPALPYTPIFIDELMNCMVQTHAPSLLIPTDRSLI